jgi:histidinol-phosphate aminotransferase
MPARDLHDAFDVDVPSFARGQLSRRHVIGGLLSAAAVGVAGPARAAARAPREAAAIAGDVRRTGTAIRLGSNENPCGLCPSARAAFLSAADEANRYPGRAGQMLIEALAAQHKVDPSWIYVTPGSGELLRAATVAFTGASRSLVVAAPTFEAPARVAGMIGAPVQAVPVTADGHLDLDGMAAKAAGAGLFFVCNPNNPTGAHAPSTAVADFVAKVKTAAPEARVLVDEAYFEFVDDPGYATAIPLAQADPRVIVTRTFSKIYGMAGLRVGYAIAQPATLAALRKEGSSGIMSSASLAAALAAVSDTAQVATERARNLTVKRFTREAFEKAGYRVLPSSANFVMIDVKRDAGAFGALCRQQQIFVARPFPPLTTCMRLTIGTQAEMEEAVPAMLALLAAPASARVEAVDPAWSPGGAC